jgi:hypothetical protein
MTELRKLEIAFDVNDEGKSSAVIACLMELSMAIFSRRYQSPIHCFCLIRPLMGTPRRAAEIARCLARVCSDGTQLEAVLRPWSPLLSSSRGYRLDDRGLALEGHGSVGLVRGT